MNRPWIFASICLIVCGCGDVTHNAVTETVDKPPAVAAPDFARDHRLGLLGDTPNEALYVGDGVDQVARFYHPPSSAYTVRELPQGFEPPYRAETWIASGNGVHSRDFGVIFYDNKTALAMFNESGITEADVSDTQLQYLKLFGLPAEQVPGLNVRYWFWNDAATNERLMICAVRNKKDPQRFDLTTALGSQVVMNALRMSKTSASNDRQTADPNQAASPPHPG